MLPIPELSLVVLVGSSGSGKSTFAAKHFKPTEVLSSDFYRGVVSNDPNSLEATDDAFESLRFLAAKRLKRGLLTVIDATNVHPEDRKHWVRLAKEHHVIPVAIVLDLHPKLAIERNASRPDRKGSEGYIRRQASTLRQNLRGLKREGFRYTHVLRGSDEIDSAVFERQRPWTDRRDERGPFDIIGDVHGCAAELKALIEKLGWELRVEGEGESTRHRARHTDGRKLLFLGDLVDRGPSTPEVLHLVMDLVAEGSALCIPGNHEVRLERWLTGRNVKPTHGLAESIEQLSNTSEAFRGRVLSFLQGLVSHFVLDEGRLVVAHAGMREDYAGRASGQVRQFALYGDTTGETDEFGLPVRYPWARDYRGKAAVIYGHTPVPFTEWLNNTLCIDTGCVFGGELTALRWPERELISVPAEQVYCEPIRPLQASEPAAENLGELVDLGDIFGKQRILTRYKQTVPIREGQAATALEVLSRFAEHPRWLIHLPPTMSPVETSARPDMLEHPDEAFSYFRAHGVESVVCEEKHMGSRALVLCGRSVEAIRERFGLPLAESPGILLSRRGRRFFDDRALEAELLQRLQAAIGKAGLWERLQTDWVLLDCELMPWSAKARALLLDQYAPVGMAARTGLSRATELLRQAAERMPPPDPDARAESREVADPAALLERFQRREAHARAYVESYRRYTWKVDGIEDLRLAPFHLLASEGHVHTDKDHPWHMTTLAELSAFDPILQATRWREVRLDDPEAVQAATDWWTGLTQSGGEGMVVKPRDFLAWHRGRLIQPALKVRGPEYLRIIYGPEYTAPEHLQRLRTRAVKRKRSLAMQELVLGLESLERFVAREPLRRVHPCVLGILALEAEEVDPRL